METTETNSIQRLKEDVRQLAGVIGERNVFRPEALHAAAAYIENAWRNQGYAVERQTYTAAGVPSANLEISIPGSHRPGEILLIGAHYDSVRGSPGADDNASAVAALLEISRFFAARRPARTVRLVAFVNEEPPFFTTRRQGSMVYAAAARKRRDDIRLMLSLEMLGYYSSRRAASATRLFWAAFTRTRRISSPSWPTCARAAACSAWSGLSRPPATFQQRTSPPSRWSPVSPGATTALSGAAAIAP